jgi:GAF domain-containing protein
MAELDDPHRISLIGRAYYEPTIDPVLDALLERAILLASTPQAMVSIVGAHTQVFRAHRGLPPELAVACGTSRSSSFCQLVIRSEDALVVTDAATDPRVSQELVEAYGIRAYAGMPIRRGATVLGSLCVVDVLPRAFPETVLDGLRDIADQVSAYLEQESLRRERAIPPADAMTASDLHARVETLLAALSIIEPSARDSQLLRVQDVTGEALVAIRGTVGEVVVFHEEMVRVARDLEAFVARFDRSDGAEDLHRDVDDILRTLGEVSVMTRVAGAFLRDELDAESAARAMGVARDVLFAADALVRASTSLLRTLEMMGAAGMEATSRRTAAVEV